MFIGSTELKLKLQFFGYLMRRTDSLEKTLVLGKIKDRRRRCNRGRDGWMSSLTRRTWVWATSGRQWRTGKAGVLQSMGSQRVRHHWVTEEEQSLQRIQVMFHVKKNMGKSVSTGFSSKMNFLTFCFINWIHFTPLIQNQASVYILGNSSTDVCVSRSPFKCTCFWV